MTLVEQLDDLVRAKRGMYVKLASRIVGAEESEDVVQNAFVVAFEKLGQFEGRAALGTWVCAIVLNSARMRIRQKRRFTESHFVLLDEEAWNEFSQPEVDQVARLDGKLKCERMLRAITRMAPCYRKSMLLRSQGFLVKEIAKKLGIQVGTVKAHLHRGKARLLKAAA